MTAEKVAIVVTGRNPAVSEPADEAELQLRCLGRFAELLHGHTLMWERLWERFNIYIGDKSDELRLVRLHLLHLFANRTPPIWTPARLRGACMARPTVGTSSGMSC